MLSNISVCLPGRRCGGSTLCLEVGAPRRVSDGWGPQNTCRLGPEGLTQAPLLPSLLVSRRSLGSPGHAWDALRLSHPGWQGPSKPRHGHHPPEKEGWADPVRQALEPPGILGTPFSSPAHGPAPPQEGKGSCRCSAHRHWDLVWRTRGLRRCHRRWVLGPGASLHWGPPEDQPRCVPSLPPQFPGPSEGTATHGGGEHLGGWLGDSGPRCPSHSARPHTCAH